MRACRLPLLLVGLSLAAPFPSAQTHATPLQTAAVPAVMAKAVDGFVRPGYRDFTAAAASLQATLETACAAPSAEGLAKSRSGFERLVRAWSRIEIVRVGPVIEDNRFEHILFYPDRKGLALKQIQGIIASGDASVTTAPSLRQKSVALQGLGALDYLLSGTGAETLTSGAGTFRCRYAAAIAGNVAGLGADLVRAWDAPDGVQRQWKQPGPDNDVYRDDAEAATGLLGILVHGAEAVRDERIESFYKGATGRIAPKQAIYWRSGLTFVSLQENLRGLQDLLTISDIQTLLPPDKRVSVTQALARIDRLAATAASITPDIDRAITEAGEQAKLEALLADSRDLITLLSDGIGGAIGLSAGFSFADGD